MKLIIEGDVPSKKNSKRIMRNRRTGKRFILSSKAYLAWEEHQSWLLPKINLDNVKSIQMEFFPSNKRKFDLTNKAESIMDLFVKNKLIKDDNYEEVPEVGLKFGEVDKNNPRVEVEIII